jgi:dedicator of cytokinesis protein 3
MRFSRQVLICEDSFPSVLRRSEIIEIRITEVSPIETALLDLATQSSVLVELEHRYRALGQTMTTEDERTRIRTGDLSMLLNSLVDVPEGTGTIRYKAFLTTSYRLQNPEVAPLVEKLAVAMDDMVSPPFACACELR